MEKVQEMVLAAQEGDMEAFSWLYQETYNRNYYIVIKMVKQEQDAMDILQDAYVKIFQKLSSFHYSGSKSFASWTGKIASNTALDFLRKKNPIFFSEMQGEDDEDTPALEFEDESVENQPELAFDRKETARIVQELLDCLSEEQRICVILRYVREMKVSEIAAECGCSENTVKSRLSYAKKRLLGEQPRLFCPKPLTRWCCGRSPAVNIPWIKRTGRIQTNLQVWKRIMSIPFIYAKRPAGIIEPEKPVRAEQ